MDSDIGGAGGGLPPSLKGLGLGHVTYSDGAAAIEANAITVLANTPTILSIDGLGPQTETRWRGTLPANAWQSDTHNISQIGQGFGVLVEFKIKKLTVGTDDLLRFWQDIGADPLGGQSIKISPDSKPLLKGQGIQQDMTLSWPGYGKETFLANGAKYIIQPTVDVQLWGAEIFIEDRGVPPLV